MKKLPKYLSAIALVIGIWGAFSVPSVDAQVILAQQPNDSQEIYSCNNGSTPPGCSNNRTYQLGQQTITGSSSAISINTTISDSDGTVGIQVLMTPYYDSSYSVAVGQSCLYLRNFTGAIVSGRQIIEYYLDGGTYNCNYSTYASTTLYWTMSIQFSPGGTWSVDHFGNSNGVPYFVIAGEAIDLIPSITSSQFNLSGAFTFCNDIFASSTGIGSTIMNGLCVVGGYLFIPSYASIQAFSDLSLTLQEKIPFSYGYDIAGIFSGMSASSTENFPTYSIGLNAIDFSSSTAMGPIFPTSLDFLSSTTINKFLSPGMHDILYNFAIFVIWVEVAFVLYRKIVPTKAKI